MNPDQPSREQIETRITALLLGELPADEAALLRYTISQDPALKKLHDQIESSLPLVREAAKKTGEVPVEKPAPMKLSAERREKLLAHFKTARPEQQQAQVQPPKDPLFWLKRLKAPTLIEVLVVIAIIAMLAAMLLPTLSRAKMKSQHTAMLNAIRQRDLEAQIEAEDRMTLSQTATKSTPPPPPTATEPPAPKPAASPAIALPAAQPEAGQLAYDNGTRAAGNFSFGLQTKGGPMSADEIAGHVIAPKNSQVYSQNIIGYANGAGSSALSARVQPTLTVTVPPEPQLAPPPAPPSTQIVLPRTEPELGGQGGAPVNDQGGVYSQNIVGYVAVPAGTQFKPVVSPLAPNPQVAPPPSTVPAQIVLPQTEPELNTGPAMAASDTDKLAIQTADSEAVLRQPNEVVTREKQLQEANKVPNSGTLNGVVVNFDTAPGGAGGIGGGGGGFGGFGGGGYGPLGGVTRDTSKTDQNGITGLPPTQNSPQAQPQSTLGVPATTTFAFDDSGLDGGRGKNQNAGIPPVTTTPPGGTPTTLAITESAEEKSKAESPDRRFSSGLQERGTGTVAGNRFYRNPAIESDDKKVPMAGDIPVMGRLFQSSTAASAPPASPAPLADTFAIDGGSPQQMVQRPRGMAQDIATLSVPTSPATQSPAQTTEWAYANPGLATAAPAPPPVVAGGSVANHANHINTGFYVPSETNLELSDLSDQPAATRAPDNHFISRYAFSGGLGGGGQSMGGSQSLESTNLIVINGSGNYAGNRGRSANVNIGGWTAPSKKQEELIAPGEINFQGVDVSEALDVYAKLTGRTILRGALPQRQIILNTQSPLTKSETIEALQAVLALNGVSTVNVGDKFVKALPSDQAGTAGGEIDRSGSTNVAPLGTYVTRVVQLKYLKPSEMVQVIHPFAGLANSILPMDTNGILVLRDKPENVNRMVEMIDQVDVNVPTETISEVVPIHYAKVDDIANALKGVQLVDQAKIITNPGGSGSGGLLIYATRADMEAIKEKIAKLDAPSDLPLRQPAPNTPVPQPEILTSSNNFSTFSMNVSDVSFKFAEASLQNGKLPDTASIRSEEFINAFDYRDPEAAAGQPMAFTSERALYPFAHNRELLRFSVKTAAAGRQEGRPLNLVLLLDTSGSMERADRVEIVREALRVLSSQLHANDIVSVVSFARTARLWADGVSGDKAGETLDQVGSITPEGGTNLEEAMRLAYETARRHYLANGMNRVVLLTDGAANLGNVDPTALKAKVETQRKQGIALDCFGIGWEDFNDDLLEELSSNGDGRYAFLNSPEDATKDFAAKLAGALQVAAQDLKVQVEFNPQRVTAYRQIGYAKHQLTKEQFRDNTVAAGEIAAQEAGNALYTVDVKPDGEGPIATVHVRYRLPGTQDYREHSWDVEYTGHATALDLSSPAMRLAATASAFSEWLAASPYAQEVTPDELLKYLSGVPEVYGADDRPKQLETMIREAKSLEGK